MNGTGEKVLRSLIIGGLFLALTAPAGAEWNKGLEAFNSKDYQTAIKEFEEVTKTNEDYAGGYYMKGNAEMALKKYSQAIASYQKAVEKAAENPAEQTNYKVMLGKAFVMTKQYQNAYQALKPVALSSVAANFRTNYALWFAKAATETNRPGEAVQTLRGQIKADGNNASLWSALGYAHAADHNDKKAFEAYNKAYQINSKDRVSARNGIKAALSVARRAAPNSPDKVKYYTESAKVAEKLSNADPKSEHILLAGESWLGAKQYSKALIWFEKAKAKEPNSSLIHFYIGQCHSSKKEYAKAVTSLQAALKGGGAKGKLRTNIYNQLGYVYDHQKNFDKAIQAYTEAGNSKKVADMKAKKDANAQNQLAAQEQREYEQKIAALEQQIKELEELGDVEEANRIREFLEQMKGN